MPLEFYIPTSDQDGEVLNLNSPHIYSPRTLYSGQQHVMNWKPYGARKSVLKS